MVMHARKLPRLNDGYFDRNASHLQGSGKYRVVDEALNNSNGPVNNNINRSMDRSPERSHTRYVNKTTYMQRLKEREKERLLHDKDSSKSPMNRHEKSSSNLRRDSRGEYDQHRSSNHSKSSNDDNKERRVQVGDWSEHISSSGKKYYYNCKTEVSQWEKPKGWLEWERAHGMSRSNHCDQPRQKQIQGSRNSSSSNRASDKHSMGCRPATSSSSSSYLSQNHVSNSASSRLSHDHQQHHAYSSSCTASASSVKTTRAATMANVTTTNLLMNQQHHYSTMNSSRNCWNDFNNITSLNNVRLSDNSKRADVVNDNDAHAAQDMDISPATGDDTPTSSQQGSPPSMLDQTPTSSSQVSLAASLPKLLSQLASSNKTMTAVPATDKSELSAHEALRTIKQALELTRHAKAGHSSGSPSASQEMASPSASSTQLNQLAASLHHALEARIAAAAPPRLSEHEGRGSPSSESSHKSFSKRGSPTSSVSSLHSLNVANTNNSNGFGGAAPTSSLASLRPQTISLTPSLANYYREDLISHVTGWQADQAEVQANKCGEEAYLTGSLNCTKVSAELKTCRSFVRLAEIQATLQEQRILFIRQQTKDLEEWKSQNLFMSDS